MKKVAETKGSLTAEERKLLSTAYEKVVGPKRFACRDSYTYCIFVVNPRRACARVTVVVLCVCVCVCVSVHGSNLLVAQLRDKLVILTGSVSWSLQN